MHPNPLQRHFGLLQATALNVTMIVGAGVFVTIPYMLQKLPGPYAALAWVAGAILMLLDGLIWSELGAALPGSGGSYIYLLESYGREKWGRPMAFLFIWQFLISGPLELGSGLIAIAAFSNGLHPDYASFNASHRLTHKFVFDQDLTLGITADPSRFLCLAIGALIIFLLYRRITTLGKLTVTIWIGVLAALAWVLIDGGLHFDPKTAFDFSGDAAHRPENLWENLGGATLLAMYSYLGYYSVCYIGDEVKDPGRTIPRAILLSALLVGVLFVAVHFALMGVVPWTEVPKSDEALGDYSLAAEFMQRLHPRWGSPVISVLLVWCCFGSAFAGLLGYARIPYGAARQGHFYSVLARVHPTLRIPHVALLAVGAMTLFWSFFDLDSVIKALVVTRILEQFVAQIIGVVILRQAQPNRPRPYRIWFYPLPCLLALAGWIWLYVTTNLAFILLGLGTLALGIAAFLIWSWRAKSWPFGAK
jgi:APA family basic amino acid/polyamine antiporter